MIRSTVNHLFILPRVKRARLKRRVINICDANRDERMLGRIQAACHERTQTMNFEVTPDKEVYFQKADGTVESMPQGKAAEQRLTI